MVDVFISYPRSARAKVEAIKVKLDALGLDCFFDMEKIDGGTNFPDIIDRALRGSKAVLCCWSPLYHPDGERALVIHSENLSSSIRVVTNWFAKVERLVQESEAETN